MYEILTNYIPSIEKSNFGKWVQKTEFPFVMYNWEIRKLAEKVDEFVDIHKGKSGFDYCKVMEESEISWSMKSMKPADVSRMDGRTVIALLQGAFHAEKYCDGAILEFCVSGCILRWLRRLKEIDDTSAGEYRESADLSLAG